MRPSLRVSLIELIVKQGYDAPHTPRHLSVCEPCTVNGAQEDFTMRRGHPFPLGLSFLLLLGLAVAVSIPLASCGQGSGSPTQRSFSFTTVDFPGTTETLLFKLNASGEIVGGYTAGPNVVHGFLLQGGTFTTFDVPNGVGGTQPEGINDSSQVTATYYDPATGLEPGFLRQPDGSVMDIVPPNSG